jgi:Pyruvate/2-oxoacid:ferredoxin oxidoreductase gamma subunit
LLLGQLLTEAGMREGLEVSWLPSYGPEMRSGSAHCHVCLSKNRIGSPLVQHPDVLIAMNEISLRKFASNVRDGGLIIYNGRAVPSDLEALPAQVLCVPASEIADKIGSSKVSNIVLMGALLEETGCLDFATAKDTIAAKVKKVAFAEMNRKALQAGRRLADSEMAEMHVSQPDGFPY